MVLLGVSGEKWYYEKHGKGDNKMWCKYHVGRKLQELKAMLESEEACKCLQIYKVTKPAPVTQYCSYFHTVSSPLILTCGELFGKIFL